MEMVGFSLIQWTIGQQDHNTAFKTLKSRRHMSIVRLITCTKFISVENGHGTRQ